MGIYEFSSDACEGEEAKKNPSVVSHILIIINCGLLWKRGMQKKEVHFRFLNIQHLIHFNITTTASHIHAHTHTHKNPSLVHKPHAKQNNGKSVLRTNFDQLFTLDCRFLVGVFVDTERNDDSLSHSLHPPANFVVLASLHIIIISFSLLFRGWHEREVLFISKAASCHGKNSISATVFTTACQIKFESYMKVNGILTDLLASPLLNASQNMLYLLRKSPKIDLYRKMKPCSSLRLVALTLTFRIQRHHKSP